MSKAKTFEMRWARITAVPHTGWTIESDGILKVEACSVERLEELIEQLAMGGWILVSMVTHKATNRVPLMRDLYFRREIKDENET